MAKAYQEPPVFKSSEMVSEGDFVTAIGKIALKNDEGKMISYSFCDVWRFREGKMAELQAFVIPE